MAIPKSAVSYRDALAPNNTDKKDMIEGSDGMLGPSYPSFRRSYRPRARATYGGR